MSVRGFLILILIPFAAWAQGFSGLGTDAEGFAVPRPDPVFDFPADHGPHPDYRIEWWYLTANLKDESGTEYGLQWTLFRSALTPGERAGWNSPQVWFAHAAVTTPERHLSAERFARGGIGQAGVEVGADAGLETGDEAGLEAGSFRAWIDEWGLEGPDFDRLTLSANAPDFAYSMTLTAEGPLVFHGDGGYSVKSAEGQASYYYSQPAYRITGTLVLPEGEVMVEGEAWLDREWSSQPLSANQSGWDWFSLTFDDETKLMGFLLRQTDGSAYSSATWIDRDGQTTPYPDGAFRAKPLTLHKVAGREVPVEWRVELPERDLDVTVRALNRNAWMGVSIPYWEGPVRVEGSHQGVGYLEMTGYE